MHPCAPMHPCKNQCNRNHEKILHSDVLVCSYCPLWIVECEAKYLLSLPLTTRRAELAAREKKRSSVDALKAAMIGIHRKKSHGR